MVVIASRHLPLLRSVVRPKSSQLAAATPLGLPADMIATSDDWGVSKPDPGFFRKMIEVSPVGPGQTLYVGDRLDNDIIPAARVGLRTALINRGPWATIWRDDPAASQVPTLRVDSLAELPGRIAAFNAGAC
jgi:FMN phosphatase YigB (HAD superfamily)